jgi:hypothetical protein
MSGSGDTKDYVGTPQPDALIPALEEGQLTALQRSGASGTGCPLTGKCGGKCCRSTLGSICPCAAQARPTGNAVMAVPIKLPGG